MLRRSDGDQAQSLALNETHFPFLLLPTEIRNEIYISLLTSINPPPKIPEDDTKYSEASQIGIKWPRKETYRNGLLYSISGLLLTNRQINGELMRLLASPSTSFHATFHLDFLYSPGIDEDGDASDRVFPTWRARPALPHLLTSQPYNIEVDTRIMNADAVEKYMAASRQDVTTRKLGNVIQRYMRLQNNPSLSLNAKHVPTKVNELIFNLVPWAEGPITPTAIRAEYGNDFTPFVALREKNNFLPYRFRWLCADVDEFVNNGLLDGYVNFVRVRVKPGHGLVGKEEEWVWTCTESGGIHDWAPRRWLLGKELED
ncbi:uncharacterized protein KY384_000757 [Bacidia gigantensis]|uniref:uncharacterized protein n=1 Tax=Bacidia gigantensis TaxID=2732470 RepID=UPI001D055CD8|nr:uncharacterized protein KY384_000757 [Bacidia gigantensis]KAG8525995.1 hypothetical protein KY384_000757 [Bacidia gigantensis]